MQDLYIETNGTRLHVHYYAANGPAVIFIHYSSGVIPDWDNVIPYFLEDYHVIVPEMRGHGLSDKPLKGNTVGTMANDVIGMMDVLGVEKAHIVGSSLGSDIGIVLAANFPNRILSISCEGLPQNTFGPYGQYPDTDQTEIEAKKVELRRIRAQRHKVSYDSKEALVADRQKQLEQSGQWHDSMASSMSYNVRVTEDGRFMTTMPAYVMDEFMEDYWDIEFEHYFDKIKCPVLLFPSADEAASESMQVFLRRAIQNVGHCRIVEIPESFHCGPMFFQPRELSQAILELFIKIDPFVQTN